MNILYQHPDGHSIDLDGITLTMTDSDDQTVSIPIGPLGVVELGNALLALEDKQEEKLKAERAGAAIGGNLLDALLVADNQGQRVALIQSAILNLATVKHHDRAAAGFAMLLVNVLEIGLQHAPRGEQ